MARKKKKARKYSMRGRYTHRPATSQRRSTRKSARRRKQPKRGCGKRNWRRGSNALWKCKRGKRRYYKAKRK